MVKTVSGRMLILGSFDLFQKLTRDFDFELHEASSTENHDFFGMVGAGQVRMARTTEG